MRFLIALLFVALAVSCLPSGAEACHGKGFGRLRHPFNGNGVPVLRRLRK